MKSIKITHYITTALLSLAMIFSAYSYLAKPELKAGFTHLGFPDYFRVELAVAKILAAIALWLPFRILRELAYAGLAITFVSAFVAHTASGDPVANRVAPLLMLLVLIASYGLRSKLYNGNFAVIRQPKANA